MDFRRVLARAVARRIAYVVVAALLAALGIGRAYAAEYSDQGAAFSACKADDAAAAASPNATRPQSIGNCNRPGNETSYGCRYIDRFANPRACAFFVGTGSDSGYTWPANRTCSARPDEHSWTAPVSGATQLRCNGGCMYEFIYDASGSFFGTTGGVCTVDDAAEPELDSDGDGVPDHLDIFPNDPNEWEDSDGDGIGDNADVSPNDPTNGDDKSEDGEDNGERDNKAEGGGNCKTPPSCSGDGIQCNQLFQQWSMRCKGAELTGDPTNCTGTYVCSGDTAQCAMIALARKQACGKGDGEGQGNGDENGNGQPDWTEGDPPAREDDEEDDVLDLGIRVSTDLLDREEFFGGGSCPALPSFAIMGKTIDVSSFTWWCTLIAVMRAGILIMGAYAAIQILLGRV